MSAFSSQGYSHVSSFIPAPGVNTEYCKHQRQESIIIHSWLKFIQPLLSPIWSCPCMMSKHLISGQSQGQLDPVASTQFPLTFSHVFVFCSIPTSIISCLDFTSYSPSNFIYLKIIPLHTCQVLTNSHHYHPVMSVSLNATASTL